MKFRIVFFSVLGFCAACAGASIDNVQVRQQWPWSTDVIIDYTISGVDAATPQDVVVTAYSGDQKLDVPSASLSGTRHAIAKDGTYRIVFDPAKSRQAYRGNLPRFSVELSLVDSTADSEVLYKIYDIDTGRISDVSRADLMNGDYGSVKTNFSFVGTTSLTNVLIWTGVTNDIAYKTSKIVLRKIPAGTFLMGSPETEADRNAAREYQHEVTLTRDYYMGVFRVTRAQWLRIHGQPPASSDAAYDAYTNATYATYYASYMNHNAVRGAYSASSDVGNWPTGGNSVADGSFIGSLRKRQPACGYEFDLPTEAQWEYACRAGTTNMYYTGANGGTVNSFSYSGTEVGQKLPNAFGLYDLVTTGSGGEIVLDYSSETYGASTAGEAATDPKGGTRDQIFPGWPRVMKGSSSARSADRNFVKESGSQPYGLRLAFQPEGWAD